MTPDDLEALRALSEEASPEWGQPERGSITWMVRERGSGPQIGNFICIEDAVFAVAAVNYVRKLLADQGGHH
jgi:hypothetical protein